MEESWTLSRPHRRTTHPTPHRESPDAKRSAALAGQGWSRSRRRSHTRHEVAAQEATPEPRVIPTPDSSLAFKVVLHVATPDGWPFALSNLAHLTQSYPQAEVLCVVDGTGIYTLQGSNDLTAKMATVFAAGARLQVCGAALQEHQIDPGTLPAYAEIVAGGVVALVQAQAAGFAYVRP
jgi:intracellular sulfur oxidation DsrE/DsrF family protein